MPLFKRIQDVKKYLPISYSNTDSSLPKMQDAVDQEYLIPVLGAALFATLQAEADGALATPSALLKKVWAAAAPLYYYKELPFLHTQITDIGIKNVTTDKMQGAYRYQYEDILQQCENEGLAALENLYQFLWDNKATYTTWVSSTAYTRTNRNLIKTGVEFTGYYNLKHPHRTFYALQPIMQEVEDLYIISSIGQETFDALKDAASPSDAEAYVLKLLKKAVANLTIYKSISKLSVKILPEGLTIMLAATDRQPQGTASASAAQLEALKQDTWEDGNSYLKKALSYLNANASVSVFTTFFTSDFYKDPAVTIDNVNDKMDGIFVL